MVKAIYYFDKQTRKFTGSDLVEDKTTLPDNCTTVRPINYDGSGMYDPTWNGTAWVGLTEEQWTNAHKDDPKPDVPTSAPTPEQLMINQLGLRVAKLELQNKEGA